LLFINSPEFVIRIIFATSHHHILLETAQNLFKK